VPKALVIDDPRRRASSRSTEADPPRGGLWRVLPHTRKDLAAAVIAVVAAVAIIANAMFLQAGRHPAPMFSAAFPATSSPPPASLPAMTTVSPLPRPRPTDADIHPVDKGMDAGPTVGMRSAATQSAAPPSVPRPPAPIQPHSDPVGDLITSTRRVAAVQRVLTEFGYGQLKPTGVFGAETQAAIQKFERERKLPVTGQISDRLVRELAAATGHPVD